MRFHATFYYNIFPKINGYNIKQTENLSFIVQAGCCKHIYITTLVKYNSAFKLKLCFRILMFAYFARLGIM